MIYSPKQTQRRQNISKLEQTILKKMKKSKPMRWMLAEMMK